MIYSSKAGEGKNRPSWHCLNKSILKSNLIRCYPVPAGVGFSFVI